MLTNKSWRDLFSLITELNPEEVPSEMCDRGRLAACNDVPGSDVF